MCCSDPHTDDGLHSAVRDKHGSIAGVVLPEIRRESRSICRSRALVSIAPCVCVCVCACLMGACASLANPFLSLSDRCTRSPPRCSSSSSVHASEHLLLSSSTLQDRFRHSGQRRHGRQFGVCRQAWRNHGKPVHDRTRRQDVGREPVHCGMSSVWHAVAFFWLRSSGFFSVTIVRGVC
jgi:hypothetical protein